MGKIERSAIEVNSRVMYKFIIDENDEVTFIQNNVVGETKTYISLSPEVEGLEPMFVNSGIYSLAPNSTEFVTSQLYFLVIENTGRFKAEVDFLIK